MTQLNIKIETKDRLKKLGEFGETFDDVINRVLDANKTLKNAVYGKTAQKKKAKK